MTKILNGVRYDTEKATLIGSWDNGLGPRDFRSLREELYRTQNGSWFLYGKGGPLTRWAKSPTPDTRTAGDGILPLSPVEAREWLEKADAYDALERWFGEDIVDA